MESNNPTVRMKLDDGDLVWEKVAECLESFDEAWRSSDQPPNLADFIPTGSADLSPLALVELIKLDLERRYEVVLWEMLTGDRPFGDETFTQGWSTTLDHMTARRQLGPDLGDNLEATRGDAAELVRVLARALAAEPATRYVSAEEFAEQLRLCLAPQARRLLNPPLNSPAIRARQTAFWLLLAGAFVPNALAGWFNYAYNYEHIVQQLGDAHQVFFNVQAVINGVAFPVGITILVFLYRPVVLAANGLSDATHHLRLRCLRLGHYTALIGIAEWSIAGIVYPIAMRAGGASLASIDYFHFITSLTLCGMVAAAYPFFINTVLTVRYVYPAMLSRPREAKHELAELAVLERRAWIYLAVGFLVPMLAILLVVNLGDQSHRWMLAVVSGVSLVGFCALVFLARLLQSSLAVIRRLASPEKAFDL